MKSFTEYIQEVRQLGAGWTKGWTKECDDIYCADILAFDGPSLYGINGGKISKLQIKDKQSNDILCFYDRGWDIVPSLSDNPKLMAFFKKIIKKYN